MNKLNDYKSEKTESCDYIDKISLAVFRAENNNNKSKLKEYSVLNLEVSSTYQNANALSNEAKPVKLPKLKVPAFSGDFGTNFVERSIRTIRCEKLKDFII